MTASPGEVRLGRFRILSCLGRGGTATVYHAVQEGPHGFRNDVAIKLLHPELIHRFPNAVRMLVDEARIACNIHHPSIVRTLDLCQEGSRLYVVMEYVDGTSLREVIQAASTLGERLPLATVLEILAAVADGLYAAHQLKKPDGSLYHLVHRDIKPGNILIGRGGAVKVTDFGIALHDDRSAERTAVGELRGTPAYMCPERLRGDRGDHRGDIYSLGATLYTLVTLKPTFSGAHSVEVALRHEREGMGRHIAELAEIDPRLAQLLMGCCAEDPEDRYPDCTTVADELRKLYCELPAGPSVGDLVEQTGWRPLPVRSLPDVDPSYRLPEEEPTVETSLLDQEGGGPDLGVELLLDPVEEPTLKTIAPRAELLLDPAEEPTIEIAARAPGPAPAVQVIVPGEASPDTPVGFGAPVGPLPSVVPGPVARVDRAAPAAALSAAPPVSGLGVVPGPLGALPRACESPAPLPGLGAEHSPPPQKTAPVRDYRGRVVAGAPPSAEPSGEVLSLERIGVIAALLVLLCVGGAVTWVALNQQGSAEPATEGEEQPSSLKRLQAEAIEGIEIQPAEGGEHAMHDPSDAAAPAGLPVSAPPAEPPSTAPSPGPEDPRDGPTGALEGGLVPERGGPHEPAAATPLSPDVGQPAPVAVVGTLTVNTYPWSTVFVDGEDHGRTPLQGLELEPGPHELRIQPSTEGSEPITQTVSVIAGEERKVFHKLSQPEAPAGEAEAGESP